MTYDAWKSSPPQAEYRPLKCSACRERVWDTEDWDEGQTHCYDEDSGEPVGTLAWDYSYDWCDDDPRIP